MRCAVRTAARCSHLTGKVNAQGVATQDRRVAYPPPHERIWDLHRETTDLSDVNTS